MRQTIVYLCGSTKFHKAFEEANLRETSAGKIVLSGCMTQFDENLKELITPEMKAKLDELHRLKIDLADEVLILNVDGYVDESTCRKLVYAQKAGKKLRFWEINAKSLNITLNSLWKSKGDDGASREHRRMKISRRWVAGDWGQRSGDGSDRRGYSNL